MPRYVIDTRTEGHTARIVYRLWQVVPGRAESELLGEFDSLESAKASVTATWRPPEDEAHAAAGFVESDIPEDAEGRYPHQRPGG